MTVGVPSLCTKCDRFEWGESGLDDDVETGVCSAFPNGIPVEIFAGGFDHREPFGSETGLFVAAPGVTEQEIERTLSLARQFSSD